MRSQSTLGRASDVSPAARAVFRALIDALLASGTAPDMATLAARTGVNSSNVTQLISELAEADWIGLDSDRAIVALYPFSPDPTPISVQIGDTVRHAMCATDALGIAPMLDRDVLIRGVCAMCDAPIRVALTPRRIRFRRPRSTVVLRRHAPGAAHAHRCAATRFACSPDHAQAWLAERGEPHDVMQSLEAAFIEARDIFGDCFREKRSSVD